MFPFDFFSFIFPIFFIIFIIAFAFTLFKNIKEWSYNNSQPKIAAPAKIVAKRSNTSHSHNANTHHHSSHTTYYSTFEFVNGERVELKMSSREYGMLAEGDVGILTLQGTRYIDFEREVGE